MESKKIRSGDIKQLKKTLEELFTETLKQIPETQEMRELLK
jgi:Tfp pilus assembly protein PilO